MCHWHWLNTIWNGYAQNIECSVSGWKLPKLLLINIILSKERVTFEEHHYESFAIHRHWCSRLWVSERVWETLVITLFFPMQCSWETHPRLPKCDHDSKRTKNKLWLTVFRFAFYQYELYKPHGIVWLQFGSLGVIAKLCIHFFFFVFLQWEWNHSNCWIQT